jgi:ABC-2 type transport system permease protein
VLTRLALRRDRVLLPVWLIVFAATAASAASATDGVYPTAADRVRAAAGINETAALVALYGRIYEPTRGAISMIKLSGLTAALVAVLMIVLVVRHTRAEEEAGRLELLGATVVGRYAPLTAALLVAVGGSLLLGLLTAGALAGSGLPAAGSLAFGLAWAGVGVVFAAVAAVAAQLTTSARAAIGLAASVLGVTYLVRAVGDSASAGGPGWLSWLSAIGWGQQVRPYAGERWWVLLLPVAAGAAIVAGGYALVARRDLGAGLLPDRPGPATGRLGSPLALAWRLQRGAVAGWAVAFAFGGVLFGSIAGNVTGLVDSQQSRDLITKLGGDKGLTDAFLATEFGILAVIAAAFGVQAALRLRAEETSQRAEPVLATAVSRLRWAGSHLTVALVGTVLLLACTGFGAGVARAIDTGDAGQLGRLTGDALLQVPAGWVVVGVVAAAFGLLPRAVVAGWAALVAFLLLGELGPLLKLSQPVMDVSPFAHLPKVPGVPVSAVPLIWLTAVAAALTAAGLAGFRRRDIG